MLRRHRKPDGDPPSRGPGRLPEFVFVVTYGRSGSTLVQGLLNTLPSTLVRGENGLYAVDLYRAHRRAIEFAEAHAHHRPRKVESAFFGAHRINGPRLVKNERGLMLDLLVGSDQRRWPARLGFKEVLWHRIAAEETEDFFSWFEQVFPGARYVLNVRSMEDASVSGFWRSVDQEEALAAMGRVVEIQDHLRSTRPDRVIETRYEVITGDDRAASDQALRDLATFVAGECDEALLDRLRGVLDVGHGPNPFVASRSRRRKGDSGRP